MTWLWRICFSGLWLMPAWCASVKGNVVLTDSRDPGVRHNKDFSGVVVWLEPTNGDPPGRVPPHHFRMVQKEKHFTPHVLAIPVGSAVDFPNKDPIFHSVFSNYDGQIFDLGLYRPYTSKDVVFKRAGIVRVFCNIHPTMSAVIAVLRPVGVEKAAPRVLPLIRISETGYIPAPHKNKWDKDYPPVIDDQPAYRPNQ